jgi:hypothetical protein
LASVSLGARQFFAAVSDGVGGYRGLYLGQFKPALALQPEFLAAVRASVGNQPTATSHTRVTPTPLRSGANTNELGNGWILGLVAGGLLVGMGLLRLRRSRRREATGQPESQEDKSDV